MNDTSLKIGIILTKRINRKRKLVPLKVAKEHKRFIKNLLELKN